MPPSDGYRHRRTRASFARESCTCDASQNFSPDAHSGIDALLISHVRYDHLDVPSLRTIGKQVLIVVPRGVGRFLTRRGFQDVVELSEGETTTINGVDVRAVFAEHSSMRAATIAGTPTLGYVVNGSQRIYFAGDTDLFPGMAGLAGDLDVALVPIAGWGTSIGPGHLARGGRAGAGDPSTAGWDSDSLGGRMRR